MLFNIVNAMLNKMGNWFGIIFKIILPAIIMYRPIKMLSLSILVFGTVFGGEAASLNTFALMVFIFLYVIFAIMLFLFPKAASVVEFFLIFYYFASLGVFWFVDFFREGFDVMPEVVLTYARAIPWVLIFLAGKIFFFFFIRVNRYKFAEGKFGSIE